MASPADNAQLLFAYWDYAYAHKAGITDVLTYGDGFKRLVDATQAINELIQQCAYNPIVRKAIFGDQPVFSTALLSEPYGFTDKIAFSGSDLKPLRLVMLSDIYDRAVGGFFSAQDPAGITSWIQSVYVAGAGMQYAIGADASPEVRAAALRIVADCAIPVEWVDLLLGSPGTVPGADRNADGAVLTLKDYLPVAPWDTRTRETLSALADRAHKRLLSIVATQAAVAAQQAMPLPTFLAGGQQHAYVPSPPKAWYRRGDLLSAAGIGVALGVGYYRRHHAQ